MSTVAPPPGPELGTEPAAIRSDVDAVLRAGEPADGAAGELHALEALHQRLAAALATIDGL